MIDLPTEADPVKVVQGDCLDVLPALEADSFDSIVCDPPYELGFMGREWDRSGVAFDPRTWASCLRVLKPGGYMLAMGGTRTYHRLTCAVEDAGFEIRDCLMWVYGTGFPKGAGCLKPAWEPIVLARKPGKRVLPLGIDACRIATEESTLRTQNVGPTWSGEFKGGQRLNGSDVGRYPANVLHDGSDEVLEAFAAFGESKSPLTCRGQGLKAKAWRGKEGRSDHGNGELIESPCYGDTGTAARFFYCAKASRSERGEGNGHPTVKPLALIRWMVRLVTPEGGRVLDPFGGSGTCALACIGTGRRCLLIEKEPAYAEIARKRVAKVLDAGLFAEEVA